MNALEASMKLNSNADKVHSVPSTTSSQPAAIVNTTADQSSRTLPNMDVVSKYEEEIEALSAAKTSLNKQVIVCHVCI